MKARKSAEEDAFNKIWTWFSHKGFLTAPEERTKIESSWLTSISKSPIPLGNLKKCVSSISPILCDDLSIKRMPHPERNEVWVLVSVSRNMLGQMEKKFLSGDSDKLSRMEVRDRTAEQDLANGDALSFMRRLEKNRIDASHFHSIDRLSRPKRALFDNLNRKTFSEIWTIRRTFTIQSIKASSQSLILPVNHLISASYDWKLSFRMNGIVYPIHGLSLSLFLNPSRRFPDFPFLPLYPVSGFSHEKPLWIYQSLVTSGDLATLDKERQSSWITSHCQVSNSLGISHCSLKKIIVHREKGKLCVRPVQESEQIIPHMLKSKISCLNIVFYHRRSLHPIQMSLHVSKVYAGAFSKMLIGRLEKEDFLIRERAPNRFQGRLEAEPFQRKNLAGVDLYSVRLFFKGALVDVNGVTRWSQMITATGFGFSRTEARSDAFDKILYRISKEMGRKVWVEKDALSESFLSRNLSMMNNWAGIIRK